MKGSVQKILAEMREAEAGLRELANRIDIAMHNDLYELENQLKKSMMLNEALAAATPGVGVGVVTIEDRPAAGDGAKLRAALVEIGRMSQWGGTDFGNPVVRGLLITLDTIRNTADAALSAPARNCDKLATNADEAIAALKQRFPAEEWFAGFEMAAKWLYDTRDYCLGVVADRPFGRPAEGGAK